MSIGTAASTIVVTRTTKKLSITGEQVWFRNLVNITLSGFTTSNASNLLLLLYRAGTNVLVAFSDNFSGPNTGAAGTIDTNTDEMETAIGVARTGSIRDFDVYLYDADPSSLEMIGYGRMPVYATRDYSSTTPVGPISDETVFAGSLAIYQGKTYLRNMTTGKYHLFAAATNAGGVTEALDTEGIDIPGSP